MTIYYVASTGSNTSPYDTWAKAATSFATAVTAATASGDVIYVDQGFTENIGANVTYAFSNHVSVICSNDKTNMPPQTLGTMGSANYIGHNSTSYSIILNGAYRVFLYGLTFRCAGGSSVTIAIGSTSGAHFEAMNCLFNNSSGASGSIGLGSSVSNSKQYIKLVDCTFLLSSSGKKINSYGNVELVGCRISSDGVASSELFNIGGSSGPQFRATGCDFSFITATLFGASTTAVIAELSNCKLGSGVTIMASQAFSTKGCMNIWLYNCSVGDQHYHLAHYDPLGSTIVDTGIYANDGAKYDGTNGCSWKIITTADCSYYTPYVSPWIDCYHSGTSAITPSLEIVRSGSATAYQDDEVWAEFSYQGTSGYPLATVVSDRKGLLASAADQTTGALGAGDWTGENATSWFGKLNPTAAITPAEIGHLRARVCVGEPSVTVYVDPTIRGRS